MYRRRPHQHRLDAIARDSGACIAPCRSRPHVIDTVRPGDHPGDQAGNLHQRVGRQTSRGSSPDRATIALARCPLSSGSGSVSNSHRPSSEEPFRVDAPGRLFAQRSTTPTAARRYRGPRRGKGRSSNRALHLDHGCGPPVSGSHDGQGTTARNNHPGGLAVDIFIRSGTGSDLILPSWVSWRVASCRVPAWRLRAARSWRAPLNQPGPGA